MITKTVTWLTFSKTPNCKHFFHSFQKQTLVIGHQKYKKNKVGRGSKEIQLSFSFIYTKSMLGKNNDSQKCEFELKIKNKRATTDKMCLREFPTRPDSNWPAQLQKLAWGLKFWLQKLETLHYLGSEHQRRWSDCADAQADLRLCCSHMT